MTTNFVIAGGWAGYDVDVMTDDLSVMDAGGRWFVVGLFEGPVLAISFKNWCAESEFLLSHRGRWSGVSTWTADADQSEYESRVELTRTRIAQGDVYQANVCRLMSAEFPSSSDVLGLYQLIQEFNPAPMSCVVNIVDSRLEAWGLTSLEIASASPEIFLSRSGSAISSSPIKGTAAVGSDFLAKDNSENIMIVDLVRNDLSRVCEVASVAVPHLLEAQVHPGLVHLVSTVSGELLPASTWTDIFSATFPPGSVTGAPKSSALSLIAEIEQPRGVYCGTLGIVDGDEGTASLSVAIRTFWRSGDKLMFGTGAGITWGSDPSAEWAETELKAANLMKVAARSLND